MKLRVGINGFGRIGRMTFRALAEAKRDDIEVVAVNDLSDKESLAHLLKYDSVHGAYPGTVEASADAMHVDGRKIEMLSNRNPAELAWADQGVDLVMECTGVFTKREAAALHLEGGAKKVLISAPSGDADRMVVYGVNHEMLEAGDLVVSNASCTTNCMAPVVHVLHEAIGIERGYMSTVHSYTGDQRVVDTIHKDPRRARAAAVNQIPTTTGAARAVGKVIPALNGKIDGAAIRVPTPNVSLIDFTFDAGRDTTADEIHALMHAAAGGKLKGILTVNEEPLVSSDFNHNPASSIFDATQTQVIEGRFVRVVSWYDNEWGFSNRMGDVAVAMMKV